MSSNSRRGARQRDMPNKPNDPSTGQKRTHAKMRSIGGELSVSLDQVVAALRKMERTVAEETGVNASDFQELSDVKDTIGNLREVLSKLANDRKKNPSTAYKAISFSAVSEENLKDMGVEKISEIDQEAFIKIITTLLQVGDKATNLEAPLKTGIAHLTQQLGRLDHCLRIVNEAGTRTIINQVLFELDALCEAIRMVFVAWVELAIADKNRPVTINYQNVCTTLTGIIDYAIGATTQAFHGPHEEIKDTTHSIATVERAAEFRHAFALLEAKRDDGDLDKWLPQAIAQSMALTERKVHAENVTSEDTLAASFGLSNGWNWILGVVHREASGVVQCRHSPVLRMSMEDSEGMATILKALLCWATTPTGQLWKLMEASNEVVDYIL